MRRGNSEFSEVQSAPFVSSPDHPRLVRRQIACEALAASRGTPAQFIDDKLAGGTLSDGRILRGRDGGPHGAERAHPGTGRGSRHA